MWRNMEKSKWSVKEREITLVGTVDLSSWNIQRSPETVAALNRTDE